MSVHTRDSFTRTHVRHEFFAGNTDFLRQRGAEHHYLLVVGSRAEDFLDIPTHVYAVKKGRRVTVRLRLNLGSSEKRRNSRTEDVQAPSINCE